MQMSSTYQHGKPTIGVLAGWQFYRTATNLSYLAPIYRGISKAARDLECNLLLGCGMGPSASPKDPLKPAWSFPSNEHDFVPIGEWNTDGMIFAVPLHSKKRSEYAQSLIKADHPVIFIGSGETGPTILVDNSAGVFDALSHLFDHGHRKIAFIAGSEDDMKGDTGERFRAYQQFCKSHHLKNDPRLVAFSNHIYSGGYLAMQKIIQAGCEFTAVMASNDESALGAMDALEAAGLRVPQNVAVIGFDNRLEGAVKIPGLTSVHVPLFDIGYRAVELILKNIKENITLKEAVKVDTRLILRQSCGCVINDLVSETKLHSDQALFSDYNELEDSLSRKIARMIISQAQSFTEEESLSISKQLVHAFMSSVQLSDTSIFQAVLAEVLQRTEAGEDDAHLWQYAISQLETALNSDLKKTSTQIIMLIDTARQIISSQMQQQHRRYVLRERWTSSRLSLLTAELLTALDEAQIYEILAKHLPELNVNTAKLVLFETISDDPFSHSSIRDVVVLNQNVIRYPTNAFPPHSLFDKKRLFNLTLVPVLGQTGQLGFMIFDTENFDLYGAIVQQVGSALNTAHLYRQATEGRRLAEEANRLKSRFLSTISHELRTPLNLIVGLSGVVLREDNDAKIPENTQKDIKRIQAYAQHLGGLIDDVIDLATIDAGQFRLNKELVNLQDTLNLVVEIGSQLAADRGLNWKTDISESAIWVDGDRTRLRQVALNLINNAIKFTERGGITLSLTSDKKRATVSVRDTGPGIPPEEQGSIFDPFQRSERSIALGYPGLGLGLTICKTLIEMHDGKIEMRSSGKEGEGAEFFFTLPVVPPPQNYPLELAKSEFQTQTVLVLSPNPGKNKPLSTLLQQRGLILQETSITNPEVWQSQLGNVPPDVIVLDVSMQPDLSWPSLKAIKENPVTRGAPVFLYATNESGETLLSLDYLTKPISHEELTRSLDQHWGKFDAVQPVRTILVVDDDPNTLDLHARIVQAQSEKNLVLLAKNGHQALQLLREETIDLVLLDLQMPEMNGFDVLEAMKADKNTSEIPVIVVTGTILSGEDMERLNQGVAVILQKGLFSIDETVAHIENTITMKRNLNVDTQRLVRQAMAYIHEHYFDAISRQEIAGHVNISEDYLTFCFRQELGTTPIKYLQRYRINQAKTLLKNSQKTITEIALDVGFSESGYFSRIFHRETGMTPDQFRHAG